MANIKQLPYRRRDSHGWTTTNTVGINDPNAQRLQTAPEVATPTGDPQMYAGGTPGFYSPVLANRVKIPYTRRSQLIEERRPNVQDLLPEIDEATRTAPGFTVQQEPEKPKQNLLPLALLAGSLFLFGG